MPEEQKQAAAAGEGSLLDAIMNETSMAPSDEGYSVARKGLEALISEIAGKGEKQKVDRTALDAMIAGIDQKLSAQLDEILHSPGFQKIESAWRGLKLLVDRTNFRENIKIELFNCTKDDLLTDFEDAADITKSGLYKQVYSA